MKHPKSILLFIYLSSIMAISCQQKNVKARDSENIIKRNFEKEIISVKVLIVEKGTFENEIITNGKVYAKNKAEIKFPIIERINNVLVKNGDKVSKGQKMVTLETIDLKRKLDRNKEALDKALIDLDDRLIDYGYRLKDSALVPIDIMRMAKLKSGYNNARYDFDDAQQALNKTSILAPFSGKIADLEAKVYNSTEVYKKFCTLIDDSHLQIDFSVLETEFNFIKKGSFIEVIPFGNTKQTIKGTVTAINPLIDENGMIKITGTLTNTNGLFLDGMSVKVKIKNSVANQLIVPKEAVVQRQDREIVFTYNNGRATWNYVETSLQNSKQVAIKSGLTKGQKVIINNNLNLAHDSEVKLED